MPTAEENGGLRGRISGLRKKVKRKEKGLRAKRRAKQRRIEREEPQGLRERLKVKGKQSKEAVRETKGLAKDTKQLGKTAAKVDDKNLDVGSVGQQFMDATSGLEEGVIDKADEDAMRASEGLSEPQFDMDEVKDPGDDKLLEL